MDHKIIHPAIPVILEAEGTPAFQHQIPAVEALLAAATDIDPEELGAVWVVRLALRLTDLMLQSGQLERADIWISMSARHLAELGDDDAGPSLGFRRQTQAVRRLALGRQPQQAQQLLNEVRKSGAPDSASETLVDLAAAELHAVERHFAFVPQLLDAHLARVDAFKSPDDLWRALCLCAQARQMCFDFQAAAGHYLAIRDLCLQVEAHRDANDALLGLGQCQLGMGDVEDGVLTITRAAAAFPPQDRLEGKARVIAAHLASSDVDGAVSAAKEAAQEAAEADDYESYLRLVGIITALYRVQQRHKDAYRNLVFIHGFLQARFGPDAAAPIQRLIDTIREDLGDEAFEGLAAELLAEMRNKGR